MSTAGQLVRTSTVLGKRQRSTAPTAGPGPVLRRYRGDNVPPGQFFLPPPPMLTRTYTQRGRISNRKYRIRAYQRGRRGYKYTRAGGRRLPTRPSYGSRPPLEVKRKYAENTAITSGVWPKKYADAVEPLASAVFVPHGYQLWTRGLADTQFSGSKVMLKNISCMMQMKFPSELPSTVNVPYRLRITQGWCKQNAFTGVSPSTASTEPLPNGIVLSEHAPDQDEPFFAGSASAMGGAVAKPIAMGTVLSVLDDVGYNGVHQTEIAYPKDRFLILSDKTMNIAPITSVAGTGAGAADKVIFKPLNLKFNFTCNKQYKLLAFTTQGDATAGAEWFTPCNSPGDWIPFVCVACLNHGDYENVNQMPYMKISENAYFLDN